MASNHQGKGSCGTDTFQTYDFADFAQAFLCRNPAYRRYHARLEYPQTRSDIDNREGLAGRWGLCFPRGSPRLPKIPSGPVVASLCAGRYGH
ncbi:MAG: transcriptional regulator domain-containing protein [Blastomonas fulva]|uniref:transcriptional regulator domain-containing protein n=1 Tax=Alphaproteobacteria TaxID=28211 RepID=UPI004034E19A